MRQGRVNRRVFAIIALVAAALGGGSPALRSQASPQRVIRITAERFSFTPSLITLDVGEEVELRLRSDDTSHGFRIIGTDINLVIPKRGPNEISATYKGANPGRYIFECSRMCGAGHDFMRGELVVRRPAGSASGQ